MLWNNLLKNISLVVMAATFAACGGAPDSKSDAGNQSAASAGEGLTTPQDAPPAKAQVGYNCPEDQPTIVDICLGLTPEQVTAAIEKHNPNLAIRQKQTSFNYTDGAQQLRTDPFISEIRAEDDVKDEYFEFVFTAPPAGSKLTHVSRTMGSDSNLPAIEPFMAGLVKNYGEPTFRHRGTSGSFIKGTLRWDFPDGRVLCGDPPQEGSGLMLRTGALTPGVDIDTMIANLRSEGVADPAQCTKWLQVHIQTFDENEPVRSVDMQLTDLAGALAGGIATYAWLEETEAQARAERLEGAEMPDL